MAEQTKQAPGERQELRGGTGGGDVSRVMGPDTKGSGTRGISAPSGDIHVEPAAQAVPRTGMMDRPVESAHLAGGKTPEMIRGYLGNLTFPALKDTIARTMRNNNAPDDVLGHLMLLNKTEYQSFEDLLRDWPRLPEEDDVEPPRRGSERTGHQAQGGGAKDL